MHYRLYKRANSPYWQVEITGGREPLRRSTKKKLKADAAKVAQAWTREIESTPVGPDWPWTDAFVGWIDSRNPKSHKSWLSSARWLHPHLGKLGLNQITTELLVKIRNQKTRETSRTTANRMLEMVRAVLRHAHADGWPGPLPKIPTYKMKQTETERVRWITRAEADRLIAAAPVWMAECIRFSLATGLRLRNVRELRWDQIQGEQAWFTAGEMKAQKAHRVPLNSEAMAVLTRQKGRDHKWVFPVVAEGEHQLNGHIWRGVVEKAKIDDFRWHDLRHTWASWLAQAGVPLHIIQELGGWGQYKMVLRYAHLCPSDLGRWSEMLVNKPKMEIVK